MAGLLDAMFGPGDTSQGPPPLTTQQRAFAAQPGGPGRYEAEQRAAQQQATYKALMGTGANGGQGPSTEMANAMALNPAVFKSGEGAYMPQAPESMQVP